MYGRAGSLAVRAAPDCLRSKFLDRACVPGRQKGVSLHGRAGVFCCWDDELSAPLELRFYISDENKRT